MLEWWWLAVAVVGLIVASRMLMGATRLSSALDEARDSGEVAGIIAAIEEAPEKKHPNLWDQAIGTLWEEYHREAALALMIAAARRTDAPIVQYWLKKAMEVEPKLSEEEFSDEFLETYFQPAIASQCGRVGCCG